MHTVNERSLRCCPTPRRRVLARSVASTAAGLLGALLALPAWAYDLMAAYRDAQSYDAQLTGARAALAASQEKVPQAQAGLRPNVGATGAINRQFVDTNLAPSRNYTSQSYGVNLSYPLYRLQNVEVLEQAKLQGTVGQLQFAQAQQDLAIRVAQAYFDVLAAQDSLLTIRTQKRAIAEQLAAAKRNFEVGTATVTDQQEAQSRFDLAVAQELAALNDLDVKRSALALLTGKPVESVLVVRPGVELMGPQPAVEGEWTDAARQNNYSVQQARIGVEIARREIDRQRYATRPTVDLVSGLSYSRNASTTVPNLDAKGASIGVQVAIPLYTGGAVDSRVREAAANRDKAEADVEVARRQAEQVARQAFFGVRSGLAQVQALEAAQRSSELALASNKLGYQVGVRINIDVLNAQQQLFSTRRDLLKARYDVLLNGLRLKAAAGTLKEDDLTAVNALLVEPQPDRGGDANASGAAPAVEPPRTPPRPSPRSRAADPSRDEVAAAAATPAAREAAARGPADAATLAPAPATPVTPSARTAAPAAPTRVSASADAVASAAPPTIPSAQLAAQIVDEIRAIPAGSALGAVAIGDRQAPLAGDQDTWLVVAREDPLPGRALRVTRASVR